MKKIITAALLLGALNISAHEGHDMPGVLKANHGGVVKAGKELNLEYVVAGNVVKIYPVSHEGKDLAATDVSLTALVKLPKGKAEPVKLEIKEGTYTAVVDFKSAYRVEMNVSTEVKGKKDAFKFQIEK